MRLALLALAAVLLAVPAAAPAAGYDETQNWLNAYGRTVEHMSAPDRGIATSLISAQNVLETFAAAGRVPERGLQQTGAWPWSGDASRGSYGDPWAGRKVEFEFENRTGHALAATVWAPSDGRLRELGLRAPLPGVVYSGGIVSSQPMYYWFAQGMAEAGYVVMTYDITGQGRSEGQRTGNAAHDLADAIDVFLSDRNPLGALLDRSRIGTGGHSLGAFAVQDVGSHGGVVKAISAQSDLRPTYAADVPIQGQGADYETFVLPPEPTPGTDPAEKLDGFESVRARGVDVQEVVIESGSHMAWSHVTWAYTSAWSEAVAHWYGLAWFDRYLYGDMKRDPATGLPSRNGLTGTERATLSYEAIPGHGVSRKYRSAWSLGGATCLDMVAGCADRAASLTPPEARPPRASKPRRSAGRKSPKPGARRGWSARR